MFQIMYNYQYLNFHMVYYDCNKANNKGDNMDYNLLISDIEVPYETLCSINENLESHMKLSKSLTVSTKFFEESMTNKLSIKRKEFINNIRHLLITI